MDILESIVPWMQETWNTFSRYAYDPKTWIVLFAVLVLAYLRSIARSIDRLDRRLLSGEEDLEEIRSSLKRIEKTLERPRADVSPAGGQVRDIRNLPLRERAE